MSSEDGLIPDFPQIPATLRLTPEERETLRGAARIATRLANESYAACCYDAAEFFDEMWVVCADLRDRLKGEPNHASAAI